MADVQRSPNVDSFGSASELCTRKLLSCVGFYRNLFDIDALRRCGLSFSFNLPSEEVTVYEVGYATKLEPCQLLGEKTQLSNKSGV